jgi:hypothetical protein
VNISPEGAAIEVTDATSVPSTFKLMTANDRVVRNCKQNTLDSSNFDFKARDHQFVPAAGTTSQPFVCGIRGRSGAFLEVSMKVICIALASASQPVLTLLRRVPAGHLPDHPLGHQRGRRGSRTDAFERQHD